MAASEVCDGVFRARAAAAVERLMGVGPYGNTGRGAVERVADALRDGYESGRSWTRATRLCSLEPKGTGIGEHASLRFSIYAPGDIGTGGLAEGERAYRMGTEAEAGPGGARLYFECVSHRLKGSSERPARVFGGLSLASDLKEDSKEHREAGLTVVHAASLAVAEELECEDRGGLPEKPVLVEAD
ncbi:hypothetical protein [Streptomyces sp. V4I23]|uniref:hypothetical protein n=1 Tax=Streptomyces sp. V4I23 TaxID=3042282 RepID=UPI0027D875CF|nr:hypothetical protein [Streptomyces sp. V4I23]